MRLGIILFMDEKIRERIQDIMEMGFDNVQLGFWEPKYWTDEWLGVLKSVVADTKIEITHCWAGFDPPVAWNFYDGPITVGFVPEAYRGERVKQVLKGARFIRDLGVKYVATHLGFIPEDPNDVLGSGIEIHVQPPGKSLKTLTLLSGGEKAFVAIAIYFAILTVRPPPFVVMDEIEAALDDANVIRFATYLRKMSNSTQMVVITHKRATMEEADVLYGVTMQELGISSILRIDLDEAEKHMKLGSKA